MSISSHPLRRVSLFASLILVLAPSLHAQQVLHVFGGDALLELSGYAVSDAGDLDLDGVPDLLVGSPGGQADADLPPEGRVRVYSGADGTVLREWFGDAEFGLFGQAVSGVGDIDQDGRADVLVGSPAASDGIGVVTGAAFVYSGQDGTLIRSLFGDEVNERFGSSVHGTGDVDQDGVFDYVVGAPGATPNGTESGRAVVYSGADGDPLLVFQGNSAGDQLGGSVGGAGDVNGDGRPDIVVGARLDAVSLAIAGSARVYSGADGTELHVFSGDDFFDEFGFAVSGAGDVDADGASDVVVGAPFAVGTGRVRAFSGATGAVLVELTGATFLEQFGFSVSDAGDANDDGHADLVVGSPLANGLGAATVFSGIDGALLHMLSGSGPADGFGHSVSGAGDIDGDGFADQLVGAPFEDFASVDSGAARVFSGCDGLVAEFGEGCPGSSGVVPALTVEGCPEQANRVIMTVSSGVAGEFGVVLFGAGPAEIPMENGCFLLVSPLLQPVLVFVLDAAGETAFDEVIDPDHGAGTFASQAFVSDPGTPQGFANTNAMQFTIP